MKKLSIALPILVLALLLGFAQHSSAPNSPVNISKNNPEISDQVYNNQQINYEPKQVSSTSQAAFSSLQYKNRLGTVVSSPTGESITLQKYQTADANDPYASQWWESVVSANSAWDMPTPTKQTILAVIDTGFALQHEDLTNKIFQNQAEIGTTLSENPSLLNCTDQSISLDASCNLVDDDVDGIVDNESGFVVYQNPSLLNCTDQSKLLDKSCNRIDDDSNGYIDDVSGWDFVNNDPSSQAGQLNPDGTSTRHGTMVAGIAAATGNNSIGVAGVDWYTKILPLQTIDDDGYGDSLTVGNAIRYAADMGADVINMSLGTSGPDSYILSAVEYAYNKGTVVVAAAGNDGCNCMIYPAQYEITIAVGALDQSNNKASFSSFGSTLDVLAPGVQITSTSYLSGNGTDAYATGNGTSFAAPLVSGFVARLKGQLPNANPTQITALLTEQTKQSASGIVFKTNERGYGDISFSNGSQRSTQSKNYSQLHVFGGVNNGGIFHGNAINGGYIYACEPGAVGTTPIYRGIKSNYFYSINPIDIRLGPANGYSMSKLFNSCITQPHDNIDSIRSLQTAQEFDNRSIKTLIGL